MRSIRRQGGVLPWIAAYLVAAACGPGGGAQSRQTDGADTSAVLAASPSDAARAEPRHVLDIADPPQSLGMDSTLLAAAFDNASELPRLHCLVVARHGEVEGERCYRGPGLNAVANVKSVSKSIVSALVGIAIAEGALEGVNQPVAPFFSSHLSVETDPRKQRITLAHLLSMQSGLERTSGGNYGAWVTSPNWVRYAITRPMVAEPGTRMLYSTGNSHLLSAILHEATGSTMLAYARSRLFEPLGVTLRPWTADPQGIYFGGNEMRLTPAAMLRFGELYRNGGRYEGRQIVPESWIRESLTPRTRSPWSGEAYGYGWFLAQARGHAMFFAWGYGGQFIFVVPDLELTIVTTSDATASRNGRHLDAIHDIVRDVLVPAAETGDRLAEPEPERRAARSGERAPTAADDGR
jgi:CubicO group peptidase (beta-lactamase class C family)